MQIIATDQFKSLSRMNAEESPMDQIEDSSALGHPLDEPVPDPDRIVEDFKRGVNIAPMAANDVEVKTAGIKTPHFRHTTFIGAFSKLPNHIKNVARQRFSQMIANPESVPMKKMPCAGKANNVVSVSVSDGSPSYRALGVRVGPYYIWYWIGTHEAYNQKKDSTVPDVSFPPAARAALREKQLQRQAV
jgi:hypothetical protein